MDQLSKGRDFFLAQLKTHALAWTDATEEARGLDRDACGFCYASLAMFNKDPDARDNVRLFVVDEPPEP